MNNEELNKIIMKAESDYEAMKDRLHELYEENEKLQERYNALLEAHKIVDELETMHQSKIDKAIEYIEKVKILNENQKNGNMSWEYKTFFPYLLNILQGSEDK